MKLIHCVPLVLAAVAMLASCTNHIPLEDPEEEPLLLLEELDPLDDEEDSGPRADNSRCLVCHINYDGEKLTLVHARQEIGCEDCHGDSTAHCSDEDNITAPDRIYGRDAIKAFCMECHGTLDADTHEEVLAGTSPEVCTDCHEFTKHRLTVRTRQWDKKTRKLIMSDGVRMMTDEMLKKDNGK